MTIGIDGCRGGWLAVCLSDRTLQFKLIEERSTLIEQLANSATTLIDIPIGLSDSEPSRLCDRLLRQTLGRSFAASVFNPPIRDAVYAYSYAQACQINAVKTGKKISIQSWNIVPKIRQIDDILQENLKIRNRCFESHPELLFYHLNDREPLQFKKKTPEGKQERLTLLELVISDVRSIFAAIRDRYLKKEVADDDILDAIVLAYFADQSVKKTLQSLPNPPHFDEKGLRMAIHWC